ALTALSVRGRTGLPGSLLVAPLGNEGVGPVCLCTRGWLRYVSVTHVPLIALRRRRSTEADRAGREAGSDAAVDGGRASGARSGWAPAPSASPSTAAGSRASPARSRPSAGSTAARPGR